MNIFVWSDVFSVLFVSIESYDEHYCIYFIANTYKEELGKTRITDSSYFGRGPLNTFCMHNIHVYVTAVVCSCNILRMYYGKCLGKT